jgi:DNA oxidative demethylase
VWVFRPHRPLPLPDDDPDACLINRYMPGAKLSLHQDRDEKDAWAPIVSVSLGLPAVFLWGAKRRSDAVRRLHLESGDITVWGGPARSFITASRRSRAGSSTR